MLSIESWKNIFNNLEEENEEVEVVYLDSGNSEYGEWCLCFECEMFEDGFKSEKQAMERLEQVQKIISDGFVVLGYFVDYNGDENTTSNLFVAIDEGHVNNLTYYCPIGQHSQGDREYIEECKEITKEHYLQVTGHLYTPKVYL